jgi:hypothetical protein
MKTTAACLPVDPLLIAPVHSRAVSRPRRKDYSVKLIEGRIADVSCAFKLKLPHVHALVNQGRVIKGRHIYRPTHRKRPARNAE